MMISKAAILTASLLALALAGCQSERFSPMQTRQPEPLTPAPTGNIQSSQLPPPSGPMSPSEFPAVPGQDEQQMASIDPNAATEGREITKESLLGSWAVTSGGTTCQMFLTLTKYGNLSRGGTRGCMAPLNDMKGWDLSGKQVVLYDNNGSAIGRLSSTGESRLNGQTSSGQPVSLSR